MNKIWPIILIAGLTTLLFIQPSAALDAMVKGSHDAVALCIRLAALYALWMGFLSLLEKTGIAAKLAKVLKPLVRFLFPSASEDSNKFITMNMSANMLGLGNAATPMAIKAVKSMDDKSGRATINMIMLVVISSTSLQFLPSTVIGLRATHGSQNPADFMGAGIIATVVSTIVGVALVKIYAFFRKKREKKNAAKNAKLPLQRT
ncbi:MAG: spore maturation protein [Firmicutes bacterium]|nr:spore maturation protein [Bacillota bacterium]